MMSLSVLTIYAIIVHVAHRSLNDTWYMCSNASTSRGTYNMLLIVSIASFCVLKCFLQIHTANMEATTRVGKIFPIR